MPINLSKESFIEYAAVAPRLAVDIGGYALKQTVVVLKTIESIYSPPSIEKPIDNVSPEPAVHLVRTPPRKVAPSTSKEKIYERRRPELEELGNDLGHPRDSVTRTLHVVRDLEKTLLTPQ